LASYLLFAQKKAESEVKEWVKKWKEYEKEFEDTIIGKEFTLDLGASAPVTILVESITNDKVIVKYINSTPGRTEEFLLSVFNKLI